MHRRKPHLRAKQASILDPYIEYLEHRWAEGCENGYQLWRELCDQGFTGSKRQVSRWAYGKRIQPAPTTPLVYRDRIDSRNNRAAVAEGTDQPFLKPRTLARLLLSKPGALPADEVQTLENLHQNQTIKMAYELVQHYAAMIRGDQAEEFTSWFKRGKECGVGTISRFAENLFTDKEAIIAAMRLPWSNGQVEGQINKLKLIKRQMYGRAGYQLLRQRMLYYSAE